MEAVRGWEWIFSGIAQLEKNTSHGSSLSDDNKTKIEQVLFLVTKFCGLILS